MLLPFEWAILTLEEAKLMKDYIQKSTARKGLSVDYKRIHEAGLSGIWEKLEEFINQAEHYRHQLKDFDPHEKLDRWEFEKS